MTDFSELQGKTITSCDAKVGETTIIFECSDGSSYWMGHDQDCCEVVRVEDIAGDVADLIGTPVVLAEESTSQDDPPGYQPDEDRDSGTWTFYKLRTNKGDVTIRWLGTSNGYYSEGVDFERRGRGAP